MITPLKKAWKVLESRFPWFSNLFSEKKLLCLLAGFLILAGVFKDIPSGSAMVIGLGVLVLTYALIDIKTIKNLTSKWISWERYKYSKEEWRTAVQVGQREMPPEISEKLNQIAEDAKSRKDEERAPEDYLVLAGEAWKEKKYEDGLRLAYAGLQLEPKDKRTHASLYTALGANYSMLKSYLLAEVNYQKATQTDDTYPLPYYNLGFLYHEQGNYEQAEKAYKKVLELNPNDIETLNNLGVLYSAQGNYKETEKVFQKALELNPQDINLHINLGNLYTDQKKYKEAEKAYEKALELNPENAILHNNLGNLYADQKKYDLAEAAYNRSLELDPGLMIAKKNLEIVRGLLGEDKSSPAQPTLDLGKEKSKESP